MARERRLRLALDDLRDGAEEMLDEARDRLVGQLAEADRVGEEHRDDALLAERAPACHCRAPGGGRAPRRMRRLPPPWSQPTPPPPDFPPARHGRGPAAGLA